MEQAIGIIYGSIGLTVGVFLGKLLDRRFQVSLLRRITKRNYGIVETAVKGNRVQPFVADLGEMFARHKGKAFLNDGSKVNTVNQVADGTVNAETPIRTLKELVTGGDIYLKDGIPTIYVNENDFEPISLDGQKDNLLTECPECAKEITVKVPKSNYRNPELVDNVLLTQKNIAENNKEEFGKTLKNVFYATIIIGVMALAMLAFQFQAQTVINDDIKPVVQNTGRMLLDHVGVKLANGTTLLPSQVANYTQPSNPVVLNG